MGRGVHFNNEHDQSSDLETFVGIGIHTRERNRKKTYHNEK